MTSCSTWTWCKIRKTYQPGKTFRPKAREPRLEEISNDATVRINFGICDGDIWEPASTHLTERSDPSKFEKVAMKWVRENWRLFIHEECKRKRSQPAGGSCIYLAAQSDTEMLSKIFQILHRFFNPSGAELSLFFPLSSPPSSILLTFGF